MALRYKKDESITYAFSDRGFSFDIRMRFWFFCFVSSRPQTHVSPHASPPVHPPASAPALTQKGPQRGQMAQKETEEKKDITPPLWCHTHYPRGRRGGGAVRHGRAGDGSHAHRDTWHPATGKMTFWVFFFVLSPKIPDLQRFLWCWSRVLCMVTFAPLNELPLPLSLVWEAKRTWRNLSRSPPST